MGLERNTGDRQSVATPDTVEERDDAFLFSDTKWDKKKAAEGNRCFCPPPRPPRPPAHGPGVIDPQERHRDRALEVSSGASCNVPDGTAAGSQAR